MNELERPRIETASETLSASRAAQLRPSMDRLGDEKTLALRTIRRLYGGSTDESDRLPSVQSLFSKSARNRDQLTYDDGVGAVRGLAFAVLFSGAAFAVVALIARLFWRILR